MDGRAGRSIDAGTGALGFVEKELNVADWPSDSAYTSPEDRFDEVEQTY